MVPDMPPAPAEAEVIKVARMAARLTPDQAAAKVRDAGGKISASYWRDIERGHGGRRGVRVRARASEGLLAQMAHAVGATPAQLAGAGREDAAQVLEAILRRESPSRLVPFPSRSEMPPGPGGPGMFRELPDDTALWIADVDADIDAGRMPRNEGEAGVWYMNISLDAKRLAIAIIRSGEHALAQGERREKNRDGRAGLSHPPLYLAGMPR